MVTKLAGPFSETCRFSISPRSRLRLRPARRAALTMTLIMAECSMISAQDDPKRQVRQDRDGFFSNALWVNGHKSRCPHCQRRPQWVPCGWGGVKADHLPPSHLRAAASALARSSGLSSARASSSRGSPLPEVFATRCHLRPSILSIGAPCPLTSTRARRFWAIGLLFFAALGDGTPPAGGFFLHPAPFEVPPSYAAPAA